MNPPRRSYVPCGTGGCDTCGHSAGDHFAARDARERVLRDALAVAAADLAAARAEATQWRETVHRLRASGAEIAGYVRDIEARLATLRAAWVEMHSRDEVVRLAAYARAAAALGAIEAPITEPTEGSET